MCCIPWSWSFCFLYLWRTYLSRNVACFYSQSCLDRVDTLSFHSRTIRFIKIPRFCLWTVHQAKRNICLHESILLRDPAYHLQSWDLGHTQSHAHTRTYTCNVPPRVYIIGWLTRGLVARIYACHKLPSGRMNKKYKTLWLAVEFWTLYCTLLLKDSWIFVLSLGRNA